MRACPASWRWTSDRALLTARGPLRRTSRTPHRPGSPVPGFPEHAVDKQNGPSVASTAPLNRTTASLEEDTTAGRLHSHYSPEGKGGAGAAPSPERSPGRHRRPHRRSAIARMRVRGSWIGDGDGHFYRPVARCARQDWGEAKSDFETARQEGVLVASSFRAIFGGVPDFEARYDVRIPSDLATMLHAI